MDRSEFVPDPSLSTAEMETLQCEIAESAIFEDDHAADPKRVAIDGPVGQSTLGDDGAFDDDRPLVAGVDQAFVDDRAVSAVVVLRGREVVERAFAVEPTEIPYVPINPLIVSPGHRVSAATASELVLTTAAGYKLPEPTRIADSAADEHKRTI